jgi:ribosomal protein S6--L-glutamate ligase
VHTSKGRGFVRLEKGAVADAAGGGRPEGTVLVQRFVQSPGRDIGACVLDGRYVGAFYRVAAEGQWLTTTTAGGCYAPCDLPRPGRELAEEAAGAFGLDYTIVDLVETGGSYLIYEVSAFGGFRGLWEAYRFDVAKEYARFVKGDLLA